MPTASALATKAAPVSGPLGPPPRSPPASTAKGVERSVQGLQQGACNKLPAVQWALVHNGNGDGDGTGNGKLMCVPAAKQTRGRQVNASQQQNKRQEDTLSY